MNSSTASRERTPARTLLARIGPLPFHVTLGPYRLRVELIERERMRDRRRRVCVNVEEGRIELRHDLDGMQLVEAFLECIIGLSHFSNGCQQGCIEEAYTHSFATGMVEFAQRNPEAWLWFNMLLTKHINSDARYDHVVRGGLAQPPKVPKRVLVAGYPVTIRIIGKSECGNAFGWYHLSRQEAQLYSGLTGSNVAVVALHELTHAIHHTYEVKNRDRHLAFKRAQLKGWLSIMTDSPSAWRWLAWVMSFPAQARLAPG